MSGLLEKLKNLIARRDYPQAQDASKRTRPDPRTADIPREATGGGRRGFGDGDEGRD